MRIRAAVIGLSLLAAPVLTACSEEPEGAPAESVGVESTYCVDAEFNIVDEDYCESDESEFDPVNYMWWFGITPNPLGIGQQINDDVAKKGTKIKPSTPARPTPSARPTQRSAPSTAARPSQSQSRPSQAAPRNGGTSARPPAQAPRQAPQAPARVAPAPAPRR